MTIKRRCFPFGLNTEKSQVFCFHHAGGSALTYRSWALKDFGKLEFVPVETPGFGILSDCEAPNSLDDAAEYFAREINNTSGKREFSLFGHSLGAVMAFKTAYILEHKFDNRPKMLIVAGRHAPQTEIEEFFNSSMDDTMLKLELKRLNGTPNEVLEDSEFCQYILPKIRASYRLAESFEYRGEKVNVPILAHCGTEDKDADFAKMLEWHNVTSNDVFMLKEYIGGHFFLHDLADRYVNELASMSL